MLLSSIPTAGDVAPDKAAFMADAQLGWGVKALGGVISEAAWTIFLSDPKVVVALVEKAAESVSAR